MKPVKCFKLPPKAAAEAKRSRLPREDYEQIVLATWLTKNDVLFYHVPNGGLRSIQEGIKFKRMGVKPGVPDICITVARNGYHGLYVELKRVKGGTVSPYQMYWLTALRENGYDTYIAHGADEAIEYIKNYLGK